MTPVAVNMDKTKRWLERQVMPSLLMIKEIEKQIGAKLSGRNRQTYKTNSADPVTYEYTAENRLAVVKQGGTVLMAAMYDGDNNRVFELDNTYKWEDCYGDEVLIPENQRTKDGDSPKE